MESAIFLILITRRVLAFFRVNPAKSFNHPNFFYPERLFLSIVGSASGRPGETGRGGGKKIEKSASFLFEVSCSQRRLLQSCCSRGIYSRGVSCSCSRSRSACALNYVDRFPMSKRNRSQTVYNTKGTRAHTHRELI